MTVHLISGEDASLVSVTLSDLVHQLVGVEARPLQGIEVARPQLAGGQRHLVSRQKLFHGRALERTEQVAVQLAFGHSAQEAGQLAQAQRLTKVVDVPDRLFAKAAERVVDLEERMLIGSAEPAAERSSDKKRVLLVDDEHLHLAVSPVSSRGVLTGAPPHHEADSPRRRSSLVS